MLTPTHAIARLSIRLTSQRGLAPVSRSFHASYRRYDLQASPPSPGSSSNSNAGRSSPNRSSLSVTNILITTATIVIATPYALELYGSLTNTKPSRPSSSSIPGKLELYMHHPLPLATSSYYPDPNTASNHKLLQIALPAPATSVGSSDDAEDELTKRLRIRSIYIKEPSLVIERAYTPLYDTLPGSTSRWLEGANAKERQMLDLLVKRYPDGELGRMLHRARPDPTLPQLEVRGPVDTWSFERDSAGPVPDRIVMVVGGTGITPAYQLLTNLFGRAGRATTNTPASKVPKIDVLYATPDLDNSLLLPDLHALADANQGKVSVSLFVERLSSSLASPACSAALGQLVPKPSSGSRSWIPFFGKSGSATDAKLALTSNAAAPGSTSIPVYESRITQQHLERALLVSSPHIRTLVLVCGPDAMVAHLAGPKSRDGQTQGALSGVLARLGLRQENVFKL